MRRKALHCSPWVVQALIQIRNPSSFVSYSTAASLCLKAAQTGARPMHYAACHRGVSTNPLHSPGRRQSWAPNNGAEGRRREARSQLCIYRSTSTSTSCDLMSSTGRVPMCTPHKACMQSCSAQGSTIWLPCCTVDDGLGGCGWMVGLFRL